MKISKILPFLFFFFISNLWGQTPTRAQQYDLEKSARTAQLVLGQRDLSPNPYSINCKVGGGVCVNAHVLSFFGITGGLECLQGEKAGLKDLFTHQGLELDCYCSGGTNSTVSLNSAAGASVGASGYKTFGHCEKVSDYEGGFLNVGLSGSIKMPPSSPVPDTSISFTIGTGMNLTALNDSVIKIKGTNPANKNIARLRLISQFKALAKTLILHPTAFSQATLIPLMAIASSMLSDEPQILSQFMTVISKGSTDAGQAKASIENQLSKSKDALDIFQRPLERMYKEIDGQSFTPFKNSFMAQAKKECLASLPTHKEKCEETHPTELSTFFKDMLYQGGVPGQKNLGKGFLGTCHAVSVTGEIGKSISTGIPTLKISPTFGYTNFAHVAKIRISLPAAGLPGSDWVQGVLTEVAHSCKLIDNDEYDAIKKMLKSRENIIRKDVASACAATVAEGVVAPVRLAKTLFSEDAPFNSQEFKFKPMYNERMFASDSTRTDVVQEAKNRYELNRSYLEKEKRRQAELMNFIRRYRSH